jgi:hypothetical protein
LIAFLYEQRSASNTRGVQWSRGELAERMVNLATQGVFVGTSSWKYPGWCGITGWKGMH